MATTDIDLLPRVVCVARGRSARERVDLAAREAAEVAGYRAALLTLTFEQGTEVGTHGLTEAEEARFRGARHHAAPAERQANRAAMMARAWPDTEICFVPAATAEWNVVATPAPRRTGAAEWQPDDALFLLVRTADGRDVGLLSLDEPLDGLRPRPEAAAELLAAQRLLQPAATLVEDALSAELADAAQARLAHTQRLELVGELSLGLAHDLNNLLMAISCSAELIALDQGERAHHAAAIADLCQRAGALSARLLDFGAPSTAVGASELAGFVERTAPLVARAAGRLHPVRVLAEGPLPVEVDEVVLTQVLLNLVVNARQASPDGAAIHVRARRHLERSVTFALLEVEDHGRGMEPAVQARVFEPFYTTRAEGTGLGLATVQRLVHQAGGRVRIDSEVGRGTTVTVALPLAATDRGVAGSASTP